ncbi:10706_t:CDS:2 [Ambispora gerdemannii]|uniref:10706_t:CDS:1 n=1 Tax=Ambispora gerdemannii TaxID=144530 RepID=A0A9N9HCX2_9GLOM|nr:10706_t:CDS:2 [Ambispora gerdemannii]
MDFLSRGVKRQVFVTFVSVRYPDGVRKNSRRASDLAGLHCLPLLPINGSWPTSFGEATERSSIGPKDLAKLSA